MSHVLGEIASQPACWRKAADLSGSVARILPRRGERIAVIGCGTSLFMAQAYAALREDLGHGESDAFPASEFPSRRRYERILCLTRSGTTTEVLEALSSLPSGTPTVAITADANAPVADLADEVVALTFADEQSIVQTRFATSALMLLRTHLGEDPGPPIAAAHETVKAALPVEPLENDHFTFLGTGWTVGLAQEAALKLREAASAWTEAYPALEYRHGPISASGRRSLVWSIGPLPPGLVDDVARTGAVLVASQTDPLAELIRAQRLAVAIAAKVGLDPDRPRYLQRSVILSPDGYEPSARLRARR
jgi:fructoselysine-6-P-deglycase FrlB-like protein